MVIVGQSVCYLLNNPLKGQNILLKKVEIMENKKKLLDVVRDKIRVKHYSISTERTYVHWIKHYIFFHNKKYPTEMAKPEIEAFLTYLAVTRKVSPTTQN